MTENERQEWNAAVAAVDADPESETAAVRLAELKERFLTELHTKIMTEDSYQPRTH